MLKLNSNQVIFWIRAQFISVRVYSVWYNRTSRCVRDVRVAWFRSVTCRPGVVNASTIWVEVRTAPESCDGLGWSGWCAAPVSYVGLWWGGWRDARAHASSFMQKHAAFMLHRCYFYRQANYTRFKAKPFLLNFVVNQCETAAHLFMIISHKKRCFRLNSHRYGVRATTKKTC